MDEAAAAFLSYCREDSEFAMRLAADVKAAGGHVWLDQLDIVPGDRWDRSVESALTSCTRMLVVLSPASVASANVMDEVSFALEEKKTVIPILHKDCAVPFRLRRVQYVDFRGDYERALAELVRTLGRVQPEASLSTSPAPQLSGLVMPAAEPVALDEHIQPEITARHEAETRRRADEERQQAEVRRRAAEEARLARERDETASREKEARRLEEQQRQKATAARTAEEERQRREREQILQQEQTRRLDDEQARVAASAINAPVAHETPSVGGPGVRAHFSDDALELAPRGSWPSPLRKQWILIAATVAVLVIAAGIYWPTRTGPQVTDNPATTPADPKASATGVPAREPDRPLDPIATQAPPPQVRPADRAQSGRDGREKSSRPDPQVPNTPASTQAEAKTTAAGVPAREPDPRPPDPVVTPAPPSPATPTFLPRSLAGDGTAKSPSTTGVETEASVRPSTVSPPSFAASSTPRPVPFGAPVRFRTDIWNLPDEPLLGFVEIPAGEFAMGSDKRQDPDAKPDEFPQHTVNLARFHIGRYEVTVGQYQAFVRASGYQAGTGWTQRGYAERNRTDLPVQAVSWPDAIAYATWLDKSLRESPMTPPGVRSILAASALPCRVTLPSEAEWEKAARGTDARVYPWGGKFDVAKTNSGQRKQRMSVGSYPDGVSPYGLLDMSGNVNEWTRSTWGDKPLESDLGHRNFGYPYDPNDSRREVLKLPGGIVLLVIRGGSYDTYDAFARAASRHFNLADSRGGGTGFRVVVSCSRA